MSKKKGFTLLEMVIVIAIILVLLSIAIPKYGRSNLTAKVAAHNANVKIIKNAAILYLSENPNATTVSESDLENYIEGKMPKPMEKSGATSFTVTIGPTGDVIVTPGELKLENGEVVPAS